MNNGTLVKMGFIKASDKWVSYDDVGSSFVPSVIEYNVNGMHALIPYIPLVDHGEPLSSFERMVLNRLDTILGDQRDHYNFSKNLQSFNMERRTRTCISSLCISCLTFLSFC